MSLEIANLPLEVQKLLQIFKEDARLVGGCVRDSLLGGEINDFDFATRFQPQKTIEILRKNNIKALETGIKFGTVTAVLNGKNFEITTLREDENQDGRHADVKFVDDYFLDAKRRDFTINALYLDCDGKIYDYFDGISDLKNNQVKFIGDARGRIIEDFLRILRFFRFSLRYGENIDVVGLKACIEQKENLKKLSRERIRQEFLKIFQTKNYQKLFEILELLEKEQILSEVFSAKVALNDLKNLIKIDPNCELEQKIAIFFLSEPGDLKNFSTEICATNKEKKFFKMMFSLSSSLDLKSLRRLLAFNKKEFVIKFYLFHSIKNSDLEVKYLKFLQEFKASEFPISAQDLIEIGLKGKEISASLIKLKIIWADVDFSLSKEDLLNSL